MPHLDCAGLIITRRKGWLLCIEEVMLSISALVYIEMHEFFTSDKFVLII